MEDGQLLYLAEAGVERAVRALRDDYLTTTQTGTADIRGEDANDSIGAGSEENVRYLEDGNTALNANTDEVILKGFDANYANTRILSVMLAVVADRTPGGTGATLEVSYSTTGAFPEAGNSALAQALTTTPAEYTQDVTADRAWTWATILNSNFTLRARRISGNRNITLDFLFLRVNYEIDTATESWSTGGFATFPESLGAGTVQSVSLTAEQGKAHLNTASQPLLRYLMVENGIADSTAHTVAANIVNYRSTNTFDSLEELQQVSGVTPAVYTAIDQDVTVDSFINVSAQGPAGARAPVNINTASEAVLKAVFRPLTFNNSSDLPNLISAILSQRAAAPFTCFYSSDAAVATDFYDLVLGQGYLSNAERDRVLGTADASSLVPREGGSSFDTPTTELSYDSNAFRVLSTSRVHERDFRIETVVTDQGAKTQRKEVYL